MRVPHSAGENITFCGKVTGDIMTLPQGTIGTLPVSILECGVKTAILLVPISFRSRGAARAVSTIR